MTKRLSHEIQKTINLYAFLSLSKMLSISMATSLSITLHSVRCTGEPVPYVLYQEPLCIDRTDPKYLYVLLLISLPPSCSAHPSMHPLSHDLHPYKPLLGGHSASISLSTRGTSDAICLTHNFFFFAPVSIFLTTFLDRWHVLNLQTLLSHFHR